MHTIWATHAHTRTYTHIHTHTHTHRSTHSGSDLNLVRSRRSFKLYDRCCDWLKVKRFPTRADQYEAVLCCTVGAVLLIVMHASKSSYMLNFANIPVNV